MSTKYFEREGALFLAQSGKPLQIYQSGWSDYTGDSCKVFNTSSPISEDEAKGMMQENDAGWKAIAEKKAAKPVTEPQPS